MEAVVKSEDEGMSGPVSGAVDTVDIVGTGGTGGTVGTVGTAGTVGALALYSRTLWRSTGALRRAVLDLLMPPRCIGRGCEHRGAWLCAACRTSIRP